MKTLFMIAFMATSASLMAQPSGRVDTRKLAGVQNYVQWEFERDTKPIWVENSLYYNITNANEGIILVRTNATVLVHVGFPNPTNNINRSIMIYTMGASTAIISNSAAVGTFTDMLTMATASTATIASNKAVRCFSTGTNWLYRSS